MRRSCRVWIVAAAAASLLAAMALGGCSVSSKAPGTSKTGQGEAVGFPVTLTDDASRTVTVEAPAKRIVSLAPANTEIVYSLGLMDRLVGVTTYDDYPAAVSGIAKVGDFQTPNLEAIAAAKPDLILVTGGVQADVIDKLEGLDAQVLVIDPKTLAGVDAGIETVGRACGVQDKAEEVIGRMGERIDLVRDAVRSAEPVSCFVEIGFNPLFTAGSDTLIGELVSVGGGRNVVTQPGYVGYSMEQLLKDQPRVYLGTTSSLGDPATIGQRPGYRSLQCVISGRVVALDDNLVSRPGPRVVEGLEQLARALHPDRF